MYFKETPRLGNTCHLMVDIETLATHARAPILAIGAVLFDPTVTDSFEVLHARAIGIAIDPADAVKVCGPVDGNTLKWWFQQSDEAIKRLITDDCLSVRNALTKLWQYSGTQLTTHIWARSPDFDCTILKSACEVSGVPYPFPFYKQRCVRTALDLAFPNGDGPRPRDGVKHDARDDAVNQAMLIQFCYAELHLTVQN